MLFDMDGLLVDTEPLWFETEAEVMARLARRLGQGGPGAASWAAPWTTPSATCWPGRRGPRRPAEVARWMMDGMLKRAAEGRVIVRPGARELLEEVAAAGVPYALVTGSQRAFTEAVLASTGLRFPVTV